MNVKQRICEMIHSRGGQGPYNDDRTVRDLGLDSLQVVELMLACEDEFGIVTTDDDTELFSGPIGKLADAIFERATR